MAFDMPLEADQPGESRFFLSFVTSPVVGTLMWILGEESDKKESSETDNCTETCEDPKTESTAIEHPEIIQKPTSCPKSNKQTPDMVESDCSCGDDEGECSYSADNWTNPQQMQQYTPSTKPRRKTSWSDQSGQSLVEYFDLTSHHDPIADAQPIKSAMKRSSTSRFNSNLGSHNDVKEAVKTNILSNPLKHQFIPSGITGGIKGGIIMPSGGGMKAPSCVGGNGHISPQWGWYISTTPPPLEKYSEAKSTKKSTKEKMTTNMEQHLSNSSYHPRPVVPVFKKSLKGSGRTHMEWPSIPL